MATNAVATNAGATTAGTAASTAGGTAGRSTENDWLFDYIVQFLKSPPWTVPLNNFIDEHCMIFDDDEENRFSYTDAHKKFIALMDGLLEKNLQAIGVSDDQFLAACEKGATQEANKLIFGQILAVNDFLTFKKMMVKRNIELNLEVMRALSKASSAAPAAPKPGSKAEEEAQIAAAIRISHEQALLDAVKRQLANPTGAPAAAPKPAAAATTTTGAPAAGAGTGGIKPLPAAATNTALAQPLKTTDGKAAPASTLSHDDELKAALAASVMDLDLRRAERAKEQAEIEHAIALSLALEKMNAEKGTGDFDAELAKAQKESEEQLRREQQALLDGAAKAKAMADAEAKARADASASAKSDPKPAPAAAPPKEPIVVSFEPVPIAALRMKQAAAPGSTPGQAVVITSAFAQAAAAAAPAAGAVEPAPAKETVSQKLAALTPVKAPRPAEPAAPVAAPAAAVVVTTAPPVVVPPAAAAHHTSAAGSGALTPTGGQSSLAGAPRLGALPALGGPKPEFRADFNFSAMSARADMLFRANRDQKQAAKAAEAAANAKAGVSADELARRQAFLRAQRDLLLAKKKAEGEAALKQFNEQNEKAPMKPPAPQPQPVAAPAAAPAKGGDDSLAKRLKAEFEANQKRKEAERAAQNFATLDAQLRRVEEIQADKQRRAAEDAQRLVDAERERQAKLAAFHKALAASAAGTGK